MTDNNGTGLAADQGEGTYEMKCDMEKTIRVESRKNDGRIEVAYAEWKDEVGNHRDRIQISVVSGYRVFLCEKGGHDANILAGKDFAGTWDECMAYLGISGEELRRVSVE